MTENLKMQFTILALLVSLIACVSAVVGPGAVSGDVRSSKDLS